MIKKTGIIRKFLVLAGLMAGLVVAGFAPQARAAEQLNVGLRLEPNVLDPTISPSAIIGYVVFHQIFEGLVKIGPNWQIEPDLATSWTVSPDGLTYIFHLRPDVKFSNGAPMDATAVKFSLDRAIAPNSINPQAALYKHITNVSIIDPLTIALHLNKPYSGLLRALGYSAASIICPGTEAHNATHPIGTGPFLFSNWQRGYEISLVRNPDYWGPKPQIAQLNFKFITDPNAALDAVITDAVDVFQDFPTLQAISQIKSDHHLAVKVGITQSKTLVAINNRIKPFNDVRVRQAMTYAIDRNAIIQAAMNGFATPIGSHAVPEDAGYVNLTGQYPYDPAKARELLAEAGYKHGFSTTLTLPPFTYAQRSGQIVAAELGAVGIHVDIKTVSFPVWLQQVFERHNFDMSIIMHVEPLDYNIYARPDYYFGYHNQHYNDLLQLYDTASTPEAAAQFASLMQRQLTEDAVNIWLFQPGEVYIINNRVRDIWHPATLIDLNYMTAQVASNAGLAGHRLSATIVAYLITALIILLALYLFMRAGWRYVLRRALSLALTLLAATLVIFTAIQLVPGDPVRNILGINAGPAAIAALRAQLGLNQPFFLRYLHWLGGLFTGNLGTSWTYHQPVLSLVQARIALSLPLTLYALVLSTLLALALGVGAVLWQRKPAGMALAACTRFGLAVPQFWFGLMLIIPFAILLGWFPAGGFSGWSGGLLSGLRSLTLPAIALALPLAAVMARILQVELLELQAQEFMRTARAKGLSRGAALLRHGVPNALGPVFTMLGLQFSFLIAGSILIENVFYLPGLGRLLFQAIADQDRITEQSVAILLVAQVVIVTLLSDLAAAVVDPRRRKGDKA